MSRRRYFLFKRRAVKIEIADEGSYGKFLKAAATSRDGRDGCHKPVYTREFYYQPCPLRDAPRAQDYVNIVMRGNVA